MKNTDFMLTIKKLMEGTVQLNVSLPVKVKTGYTWELGLHGRSKTLTSFILLLELLFYGVINTKKTDFMLIIKKMMEGRYY